MLIKAAFLQSYLIREEQNQKGDVDSELYRIQPISAANKQHKAGTILCINRSRIAQAMGSRRL
jgi:hypothetical protein